MKDLYYVLSILILSLYSMENMQCLGINKHYNYSYSTKKTFLLISIKRGEKLKTLCRQMDSICVVLIRLWFRFLAMGSGFAADTQVHRWELGGHKINLVISVNHNPGNSSGERSNKRMGDNSNFKYYKLICNKPYSVDTVLADDNTNTLHMLMDPVKPISVMDLLDNPYSTELASKAGVKVAAADESNYNGF